MSNSQSACAWNECILTRGCLIVSVQRKRTPVLSTIGPAIPSITSCKFVALLRACKFCLVTERELQALIPPLSWRSLASTRCTPLIRVPRRARSTRRGRLGIA